MCLDTCSFLGSAEKDTPLRFLVHFVGDLHQPLHLTGKARGGNQVHVRFEGHATK